MFIELWSTESGWAIDGLPERNRSDDATCTGSVFAQRGHLFEGVEQWNSIRPTHRSAPSQPPLSQHKSSLTPRSCVTFGGNWSFFCVYPRRKTVGFGCPTNRFFFRYWFIAPGNGQKQLQNAVRISLNKLYDRTYDDDTDTHHAITWFWSKRSAVLILQHEVFLIQLARLNEIYLYKQWAVRVCGIFHKGNPYCKD